MTTLLAIAVLAQARGETVTFKVGDVERTALVFKPAKSEGAPVVFMFHGHGGGSRQASLQWRFHQAWPEAVVVYPQGLPGWKGRTDPEGVRTGWQGRPGELEDRDIAFFDVMTEWTKKEFKATADKTFVTGHSNGALMTWTLQAARGEKAAGFAGACAPGGLWFREAPQRPMFIVAGIEDELVGIRGMRLFTTFAVNQYEGGEPKTREDGVKVYASKTPLWVWEYEGGHSPPRNAGEKIVEFFKAVGKDKPITLP